MKTTKYIKTILLSMFLGVVITSCNDFLSVAPHDLTKETFYKSENELSAALTGVYAPINFNEFYGNMYPVYLAGGDDLSFYQRPNPGNPSTAMLLANANSSTAEFATLWKALYEGINRANLLIENADNNKEIKEDLRNRVKAEALFLRGFYYFHLVQGWGDVPLVLKSMPKISPEMFSGRTAKQEVYDQLIKDIISAIDYLPEVTELSHVGTITKTAAKGILARIYLFRAGEHKRDRQAESAEVRTYYEEAKKWALAVKESGLHGLAPKYNQVFIDLARDKYNSQGVIESMWEAEFAGNREGEIQAAGRIGNTIGFGSRVDYSDKPAIAELTGMKNPGYSYRFIYASLKLYQMYESEGDTERGNWNIAPFEYTEGPDRLVTGRTYYYGKKPEGLTEVDGMECVELKETDSKFGNKFKTRSAAKYRREYEEVKPKSKTFTPINFPILRYSDVLLMLAEADNYLNNGPTPLAYECVNAVRTRAGIKKLEEGLDQRGFLSSIKDERAMELCFEATRRWDLIRWGDFYNYMVAMKEMVNHEDWNKDHKYAATYYEVTPAYVYFAVPDLETGSNPAITQNPGW